MTVPALSTLGPTPSVKTSIPGPRSRELLIRQELFESNARSYPRRISIAILRGQGSFVEDVDGNVFLDFLSGAGALALGHGEPTVTEAVTAQLQRLSHGLDFATPIKDRFVETLLGLLPESMRGTTRVQFCGPSGANAVDAALKLCKTYTGRSEVIAFRGGFHGSGYGAMSVTGLVEQKERVPVAMPGVHFFPYPYPLRCPVGLDGASCCQCCLPALENALTDTHGGITRPAAVIVELVQGEGGVIPAPLEFVRGLRRVTEELDIPLIVDEIQTGFGRTGSWFAFEQYDIVPDVVILSKAAGGIGMPIALILYSEKMDVWSPGAHTGTFRGNQLAFAAGVAAIDVMKSDDVLENVRSQGAHVMERLRDLQALTPSIGEVRGRGLMIGIEVVEPRTGSPDEATAAGVQRRCLEKGLIVERGGRRDAVVRLLPPLNVAREAVDAALTILSEAFSETTSATVAGPANGR